MKLTARKRDVQFGEWLRGEGVVGSWICTMRSEKDNQTSLTKFRHQMRSGDLLAYLSLNCPSSGFTFLMLFCSILVVILDFSEIQPVCDGPMDGRTYGHTLF